MLARLRWHLTALVFAVALAVPLHVSAQTDAVRDAQQLLTTFGYDPGPVDGLMGPKTRAALRSFQEKAGLRVTGEADVPTLSALGVAQGAAPTTDAPIVSPPAEPVAEVTTPDPAPVPVSRTTTQTPSRPSPAPKPEGSFNKWWIVALGLTLFLFWRGRRKKAAAAAAQRQSLLRSEPGESQSVGRSVRSRSYPKPADGAPYGQTRPPAVHRQPASYNGNDFWVAAGRSANVAGHDVGGMVYVGRGLRAQSGGKVENCLIDPSLPVARRNADYAGNQMPYWPSYSEIPPSSRLAYLRWLGSGRSDPAAELGYVFLYFYGLERRLFLDQPSETEQAALVAEVQRLRTIYAANRSFERYSQAFLEAASILMRSGFDLLPHPERYIERSGWELPLSVKRGIGRELSEGRPLSGEWLLCWWLSHPETRLRTPVKRVFDEFSALFLARFQAQYPDGLSIAKPRRSLSYQYRAASSTFERDFSQELAGYPDIGRLTKPIIIAGGIAERCMDDLDAYSRYIGRKPAGRGSIEAHALLPEELAASMPSAELESLREWGEQKIAEQEGLVRIETLIERLEGDVPTRISRRAITNAADALARLSLGLAPDPRFAIRAPKVGEPVMLFRLPGEIMRLEDVSADYAGALLSIVIGTYIAHADGTVSKVERQRLEAQIDRMTELSAAERARLRANLTWMAAVPPKLRQLRKQFDAVGEAEKQAIGQLAIAVAGADGVIDPAEVEAVQKLYRAMGLREDQVFSDLHQMAAAPAAEPVTVRPGERPKGYVIPEPPKQSNGIRDGGIKLDHDRISSIMADTHRASQVLSQIFAADSADDDPDEKLTTDADSEATAADGLDSPHRALIEELLTRSAWTEGELDQLARQFGLLTEGAIETLNEWAFDRFDDALLEADGDFLVNLGIVETMQNSTGRTSDDTTQHQTA